MSAGGVGNNQESSQSRLSDQNGPDKRPDDETNGHSRSSVPTGESSKWATITAALHQSEVSVSAGKKKLLPG